MIRNANCSKRLPLLSGLIAVLFVVSLGVLGIGYVHAQVITAAECFVDTDPGEGGGIAMNPLDGAFDEQIEEVTVDVPTDNLSVGFHTVYIRFHDSVEGWCIPKPLINDLRIARSNLRILGEITVSGAEYFVDTDPGEGNGIPLEPKKLVPKNGGFEPIPDVFDEKQEYFQEKMATSDLTGGHDLCVRVKDSNECWGLVRRFPFTVYKTPVLAGAEFFIDEDPGRGLGVELYQVSGTWERANYDLFSEYPYPEYLVTGCHEVFARFMDQHGIWGMTQNVSLVINACECDLNQDERCDMEDWLLFGEDWGRTDCHEPGVECECDLNDDARCDMLDWLLFGEDWGRTDCPICPES